MTTSATPAPVEAMPAPAPAAAAAPPPAKKAKKATKGSTSKAAAAAAAAASAAAAGGSADAAAAAAGAGSGAAASSSAYSPFYTEQDMTEDVVVCMQTQQTQQFRLLIDALKDLIPECPIKFEADGMKLVSMDPAHVALIHLHATSEFYHCKRDVSLGVNIIALYKMLRNLTTSGFMLEISYHASESDILRVVVTNVDKRTRTENKLKLLRLPDENIIIPSTTFNRVLSMPSTDLQRYIRELSSISNKIKVKSTHDKLVLSAYGNNGSTAITISPTASGLHWVYSDTNDAAGKGEPASAPRGKEEQEEEDVVEGVFLSKYLERFSKPLDAVVEVFIKAHYPLVLRYQMSLCTVRLVIAQIVEEEEEEGEREEPAPLEKVGAASAGGAAAAEGAETKAPRHKRRKLSSLAAAGGRMEQRRAEEEEVRRNDAGGNDEEEDPFCDDVVNSCDEEGERW